MVGRRRKYLKLHWVKCHKTALKNKTWIRKEIIQNLIFGAQFLISAFLAESIKANKNQQKGFLILQHSFTQKNYAFFKPQLTQQAKTLTHFTNLPANMFLVSVRKKHLYYIISIRPRNAFSKCLEKKCLDIPLYLHKNIGSFYVVGYLIISLRQFVVWDM